MNKLTKIEFLDKWKQFKFEHKFKIGQAFTNNISELIKRMQINNLVGCVMKTVVPDKALNFYMTCITKNNILILFEIALIKSNFVYSEVKYKSEAECKEDEFEKLMCSIVMEDEIEESKDIICR